MFDKNLFDINGILVNKEIVTTKFTCDLSACKGACCTLESDYGAPLLKEELQLIEESLPFALPYLSEEHQKEMAHKGFYEDKEGELVTRSLNRRACLLVYYENGIAKCSLEKVFFEGKTKFRKPVSCHLFPIRISSFGGDILRYERFSDCQPALAEGKKTGISIMDFCKDGLERHYGKTWYKKLVKESEI